MYVISQPGAALSPSEETDGDIFIGEDFEYDEWAMGTVNLNGNLTIRAGGIVTITDGTLTVKATEYNMAHIIVEDGGQLILDNARIETENNQSNAQDTLAILVRNGGSVVATDSEFDFSGSILVDDASFIVTGTSINGPLFTAISSNVEMYDSTVSNIPGTPTDADQTYSYPFVTTYNASSQVTYVLERNPDTAQTVVPSGEDAADLTMNDSGYVTLNTDEKITISGFDIGGLVLDEGDAVSVILKAEYRTTDDFNTSGSPDTFFYFEYLDSTPNAATNMEVEQSYENYNATATNHDVTLSEDLTSLDLSSLDMSILSVVFNNSNADNVFIDRVWLEVTVVYDAQCNMTFAGSSEFTAVNTTLGVNYYNYTLPEYRKLVLTDTAQANLYDVDVNGPFYDEGVNPFVTQSKTLTFKPLVQGGDDTTSETSVLDLLSDNGVYYALAGSETLSVLSFYSGIIAGKISDANLVVDFNASLSYSSSSYLQWNITGSSLTNSSILINTTSDGLVSSNLGNLNISQILTMTVKFANPDLFGINFDTIWVNVVLDPTFNIYRTVNVSVLDSNDLPVNGAYVNATDSLTGLPALYSSGDSVGEVPSDNILDYLGKDSDTYARTNDAGQVTLFLLIDTINSSWVPNSYSYNYWIDVEYNDGGEVYTDDAQSSTFPAYPDLTVLSMDIEFVLTTLVLDLPDITLGNFSTDPTTIYEGDDVTLNFDVINNGLTTASSFNVTVTDVIGSTSTILGSITVTNLAAGATQALSITWNSTMTIAGIHSIVITADSDDVIFEDDEGDSDGINNNVMSSSVTVLKYLPDLSLSGSSIVFSQNPGYANQAMYINVTVSNLLGRATASGAVVKFYLGDPESGGQLIGTTTLDVLNLGTNMTSLLWTPTQVGSYSIFVTVNEDRAIEEYLYTNNIASDSLEVILIAEDGDWVVTDEYNMTASSLSWQHNIIVEGEGYLTFYGTAVTIRESTTKIIQIMVRDDATLELISASIGADFDLIIYLFDNATLVMSSSSIAASVDIIMDDNSTVHMESSRVRGDLHAPSTSNMTLVAYNSTFDKAISDFGGSSVAILTAATISSTTPVSPKDDAVIYLYSWVIAIVKDGTGENTIAGANVEVRTFPSTWYTAGETDEAGWFTIQALSAIVTAETPGSSGTYILNATYWYEGTAYESDEAVTAQVLYYPSQPLTRSDKYVQLDISSAKPDLDPPFTVSDTTPLRGGEVALSTIISNGGVVSAYNVLIRFTDISSAGTVIIEDYIIEELAANSSVIVNVTWTASYPLGTHNLTITVDPLNAIPELNESNNKNYTLVTVLGVSDLTISASDVSIGSDDPAIDQATTISASVTNLGDFTASAFDVTFYDGTAVIDTYQISNIPTGEEVEVIVSWTPSTAGDHTITVVLDEDGVVVESSEANNEANITVEVSDYPDLVAVGISYLVEGIADNEAFVGDDVSIVLSIYNNGESTAYDFDIVFWAGFDLIDTVHVDSLKEKTSVSISIDWVPSIDASKGQYQNITVTAQVNLNLTTQITEIDYDNNQALQTLEVIDNRPDLTITNVTVVSMADNVTSGVAGEVISISLDVKNIGIVESGDIAILVYLTGNNETVTLLNVTDNINVDESATISFKWTVASDVGDYDMVFMVNATSDANMTNNQVTVGFDVLIVDPVFTISTGGKTNFEPGDTIVVTGTLTRANNSAPLVGQVVSVVITDSSGFALTSIYNATTSANGEFKAWINTPSGSEGTQYVTASIVSSEQKFSDDASINIVAPFTPESIPSWIYLLIVALVIAVIVIFSIYLYRVGLGRMVECGNCGALIPEASNHCPKCGVEFEAGTAKCSECGAWIPSKAESCPECGSKFMTEPVEMEQGTGYIESMRKQYDEYIDAFRTQAKTALGSKYSEEKFQEWLQTEPNYLPFEEWLRKEEMAKKSGVFPCPSCGTLNPRESKVCHRCGTVFEGKAAATAAEEAKAPVKAEEKKSPFRRIVRKSPKEHAPEQPKEQPAEEVKPAEEEKKTE
ncbi:MAG: hypothetical protein LUQ09_08740 [Methanomassiliicoccales archaeon]|nr:hypothetical protein [Methanomassiliicoccales archaeon]